MPKSPFIFAGRRSRALSQDGIALQNGAVIDNDGPINPILNGHFETGTLGWAAYQNTAQATPVTGNGGSPTVTITRSTTGPLNGFASGVITKDTANRQGEGVRYAFTVPAMFQSQICKIKLAFDASANYLGTGAEVLGVYLYDVTNAQLITPTSVNVPAGKGIFETTATLSATGTSYRVILHVAGTGISDWTMKIDQVSVTVDSEELIVTPEGFTKLPGSRGVLLQDLSVLENDGESNYIKNGHGELSTGGWTATGTAAIARTTTAGEVLRGVASLKVTTGAAADLVSYPFTISEGDKGQTLSITMSAKAMAGYIAGDFSVVIRDVTNATTITPSSSSLQAGTSKFSATFSASATGVSYELRLVSGATAGRQIVIDEVYVGPKVIPDLNAVNTTTNLLPGPVSPPAGSTYTYSNPIVQIATPVTLVAGSYMNALGSMVIQPGATVAVAPGATLKVIV